MQEKQAENSQINCSIAVVILSWNGMEYLEKFLPSFVEHSQLQGCTVYLADNQSSDGSVDYVLKNFPSIKIIQNERNGGYAGGYNDALRSIEEDYCILANQDLEVHPNWIAPVIETMEADRTIAAAQPKIMSYWSKRHFEYAGAVGGWIDRFGYPFCRGRIMWVLEKDFEQYDYSAEIAWATGACFFVRTELYKQFGGLDEDFFAHMEEIDLCWRFKNAGYKIVAVPDAQVFHVGGGSLPQGNPRKSYLNFRNNLIMLTKNLPSSQLFFVLFARLLLDGLAGVHALLVKRSIPELLAIIKAHWSFFFGMRKWWTKRKQLSANLSSNPNRNGFYSGSIIRDFLIHHKKRFSDLPIEEVKLKAEVLSEQAL